ncbi:COQ9 family protein [Phenylobacterium sp. LH3H17]|uniref:COQ9 family protein n=1 Tax=Phenylobacterium sp. LH3H17 TaxID=2903901 RepID=UPI0020CA0EBC|nr:COQ9 family protein [Phenylobacterium sp. LH3H17]UTP40031.1 COQ9 family protein [Phenylobacterium sp. LH3H17]
MTNQDGWAETTEQQVLDAALTRVTTGGFTWPTVRAAGQACGLSAAETELLLPNGPADLAALLARRHDSTALAALPDPAGLKIRARIRAAVEARLDAAAQDEAAVRRWAGYLSLPLHLPLAARLLWDSADKLWRWAGDTATDENHYSKRAILAGILASALAIRLSGGKEEAMSFVDARIENVMAFETWKAGLKTGDLLKDLAGALAKLRYG